MRIAALERRLVPAEGSTVSKWLASLGVLVAGNMPVADAKVKIAIYAPGLVEVPARAFTRATLYEAGRRFKWWPSFAELSEFLAEQSRDDREDLARLQEQREQDERDEQRQEPTPEERSEIGEMVADTLRRLGGTRRRPPPRRPTPIHVPGGPGERAAQAACWR